MILSIEYQHLTFLSMLGVRSSSSYTQSRLTNCSMSLWDHSYYSLRNIQHFAFSGAHYPGRQGF